MKGPRPESPDLQRTLGLGDLVLFNVAAVIGIRWLAAAAHTGPDSISLWLLAALLFFVPSALAVAALSARYPEEGGIYIWTKRAFGDWHAFLCGWCYWLSNLFYLPNLLLAGVGMAGSALGLAENKLYVVTISLLILWIGLLTNLLGLDVAKWTSNAGGAATYAAGGLIIVVGLAIFLRHGSATPIPLVPRWDFAKLNLWSQIAFAFGGLELGAVMGGEIRDPRHTVPRAAWISGLAIAAFYIFGTIAMLVVLPPARISAMTGLVQAAQAAGAELGSPWLTLVLTGLILAGVAGQLGAWVGASARVPFVMGVDKYLPPAFARLHPRWHTPHVSILLQGAFCTLVLIALPAGESLNAGYQLLVDMAVITYFIPFLYLFAAAWKTDPQSRERKERAPLPSQGARRGPGGPPHRSGAVALTALSGLAVTAIGIALSLVPPPDAASLILFELKLAGGCALLIALAKLFFNAAQRKL
jgi:glutamate:GABA antiporter